uniref:TolC family protein n=1 Tax=Sphingomonas sp. KC8 TaxID=1030157 RepID=UPI0002488A0D
TALLPAACALSAGVFSGGVSPAVAAPYGPLNPNFDAGIAVRQPRTTTLPAVLTREQAVEEALARSPAIIAAEAELAMARGRLRQAGIRPNPDLNVEVENFAGSGAYSGVNGAETTVSISQRLDIGGRRAARIGVAQASVVAQEIRLEIAKADLAQSVRGQFALALATEARLTLAKANRSRAWELARVADELVAAGREPPLRAFRAKAHAAQADAALVTAQADDLAARRSLTATLGTAEPIGRIQDWDMAAATPAADARMMLEVRLANAEYLIAQADLGMENAARRLDPSVGAGMRRIEDSGDTAFVASFAMPLPISDRNQGNIAAARAGLRAAEARLNSAVALASVRIGNARTGFDAARTRVDALEGVAVPQAAEALRLADLAYRAGRLSLMELLDAHAASAAAQSELIDARFALAEADAALVRAVA